MIAWSTAAAAVLVSIARKIAATAVLVSVAGPVAAEVASWTPEVNLSQTTTDSETGLNHRPLAVTADGSVVVGFGTSAAGPEAFRFETGGDGEGGAMVGLGDLPGGDFYSKAFAVSADGSVVVGQSHSARGFEAFRWEGGVMTSLGDLPGGAVNGLAAGVSADGRTVVGQGWSDAGFEAFVWRDGALAGLGELPGGGYSSEAFGVSADGRVAVGRSNASEGSEAVLWRESGP